MSNNAKSKALGMSHGTAANRLRKMILFSLVCHLRLDSCYRCGGKIEDIKDLSIEHKEPWQQADDPVTSFFDLENIAFSHMDCNRAAASPRPKTIFRTDQELKRMKRQWPSRTREARKQEYAKAQKTRPGWIKNR